MAALTALKVVNHKCHVLMPSGKEISCNTTNLTTGYKLLDFICKKEGITELNYFGFRYTHHKDGKSTWIQMNKFLGRQLHTKLYELEFRVRHWPSSPYIIKYDVTRYQLLLGMRRKLLRGELSCSVPTQALLASYIIQGEIGDWDDNMIIPGKYPLDTKDLSFFPSQPNDFLQQVITFHQKHGGVDSSTADLLYLENVRRLTLYGTEMHPALDADNIHVVLGINHEGFTVLLNGAIINKILWAQVTKLEMSNKKLFISLMLNIQNNFRSVKLGFLSPTRLDLKRLYRSCCETLRFHQQSSDVIETGDNAPAETVPDFPRITSKEFHNNKTESNSIGNNTTVASDIIGGVGPESEAQQIKSNGTTQTTSPENEACVEKNKIPTEENFVDNVDDDEPVILEQKDLVADQNDELSESGNLTEDDLDEEFEAIDLSADEEQETPEMNGGSIVGTVTDDNALHHARPHIDKSQDIERQNLQNGCDFENSTDGITDGLDEETVVVETSEYITEEFDPETSNVMVVTHTTYTEIETSYPSTEVTHTELQREEVILDDYSDDDDSEVGSRLSTIVE